LHLVDDIAHEAVAERRAGDLHQRWVERRAVLGR
jgi:hypothetical protein